MRVLHVVPQLLDAQDRIASGAERYAFELARRMGRRTPTRVLSFGPVDRSVVRDGVPVRIIGGEWGDRPNDPFSTRLIAEVRRADVVHCHQQHVRVSKLAALAARALEKPAVVTDHGGGAWHWSSRLPSEWLFRRFLHVSRYSLEMSGQARTGRAAVILGGVDAERFSPGEEDVDHAERRVLFVGRMQPNKGVEQIIEALPTGLGLDIAGPEYDQGYAALLRRLAEGRDIAMYHRWADAEIIRAYRRSLCLVLPSVYDDVEGNHTSIPELLGQTLLEGMACARPVICTDVAAMPEVVRDGETGYVVPPRTPEVLRDRLERLREDPDLARGLGEAGRRRAQDVFSWDQVVQRCLEQYAAL